MFYHFSSQRHRNYPYLIWIVFFLQIYIALPSQSSPDHPIWGASHLANIFWSSLRYSGPIWFLHLSNSSLLDSNNLSVISSYSCNSLFPGTSPSPCQWTHLLYSIHPYSTFYIQSIHIPPFTFMFFSHPSPLQFSFSGPYFSGPETQTQTQLTTEWAGSTWNLFYITITAVKIQDSTRMIMIILILPYSSPSS